MSDIYELTAEEREYIIKQSSYYNGKVEMSDIAIKGVYMLSRLYYGLHHCPNVLSNVKKDIWTNPHWFECCIDMPLSSFDFNALTRLVIMAHDMCCRVEIKAVAPRYMRLIVHSRKGRDGDVSQRHPTIEQAIADYRNSQACI